MTSTTATDTTGPQPITTWATTPAPRTHDWPAQGLNAGRVIPADAAVVVLAPATSAVSDVAVVVLAPATTTAVAEVPAPAALPHTGAGTGALVVIGLCLLILGIVVKIAARNNTTTTNNNNNKATRR